MTSSHQLRKPVQSTSPSIPARPTLSSWWRSRAKSSSALSSSFRSLHQESEPADVTVMWLSILLWTWLAQLESFLRPVSELGWDCNTLFFVCFGVIEGLAFHKSLSIQSFLCFWVLVGWRPSLVGWRPSLLWRPLLGWVHHLWSTAGAKACAGAGHRVSPPAGAAPPCLGVATSWAGRAT